MPIIEKPSFYVRPQFQQALTCEFPGVGPHEGDRYSLGGIIVDSLVELEEAFAPLAVSLPIEPFGRNIDAWIDVSTVNQRGGLCNILGIMLNDGLGNLVEVRDLPGRDYLSVKWDDVESGQNGQFERSIGSARDCQRTGLEIAQMTGKFLIRAQETHAKFAVRHAELGSR